MPAHRTTRRSRRLSRRSPINFADYGVYEDSPVADHTPTFHGSSSVTTPVPLPFLPSPPTFTSNIPDGAPSSSSPPTVITHLPFTPGSSHTRNRRNGHIPRPPNAFMVFRSWLWNQDNLKSVERDNRNVSRIAGRIWNDLSDEQRAPFRKMADEAKMRHAQLYPDYKYTPSFRKAKKSSQRLAKGRREGSTKKKTRIALPVVPQMTFLAPPVVTNPHTAEMNIKLESPPMPELRTPDLVWPLEEFEGFVPTEDIPLLSLDDCCDTKLPEICPLPRLLAEPAGNSALCGVKPEAALFVDECMLSAFNSYSSPPSTSLFPFEQSQSSTYDGFSWPPPSPTHSPVVFSNPFENTGCSSDKRSFSLLTLDQLFDQSISPITPVPPHVIHW
ncbi:hypothetical protein EDD16DRAFT_1699471 [Pisolithus croceorrhizus]|nr:hypothetical protein EDD16DRAFT_1699471 [Pisolithus croceorrhizus]